MGEQYLIGADIGTQGTKASLYREDGRPVCHAFENSKLIYGADGAITQKPEELYGSVLRTIRELMQVSGISAGAVAGVGLDAQMAGIMAVDEEWNAVTPYDSWLDTRCGPYIGRMKKTAEDEIIRKTGGQVTYAHGPKILWWKHERPEIYRKIKKFIMPGVYAAGRLCGLNAKSAWIDYTHLHFTGFADSGKLCWDDGLLSEFGVEREKLPDIGRPYDRVGTINARAAELTGLREGTPVVAGCGDSAASSLGAGIVREQMIYDVAGTASIFSVSTEKFCPDLKHKTILAARSAVPDLFIPLAYLGGGGMCIRWFAQMTGKSYEELETEAGTAAGETGELYFIPHFAGRTCPNDPGVRGGFTGLNWNHRAGHLYRSILESIALEYNGYFMILREMDPDLLPEGVYGVGGGTKSALFNQIKADVLGVPYHTLRAEEAATWGSAVLAGYAAGLYGSLSEAGKGRAVLADYMPEPSRYERYREKTKRYLEMLKLYTRGAV